MKMQQHQAQRDLRNIKKRPRQQLMDKPGKNLCKVRDIKLTIMNAQNHPIIAQPQSSDVEVLITREPTSCLSPYMIPT